MIIENIIDNFFNEDDIKINIIDIQSIINKYDIQSYFLFSKNEKRIKIKKNTIEIKSQEYVFLYSYFRLNSYNSLILFYIIFGLKSYQFYQEFLIKNYTILSDTKKVVEELDTFLEIHDFFGEKRVNFLFKIKYLLNYIKIAETSLKQLSNILEEQYADEYKVIDRNGTNFFEKFEWFLLKLNIKIPNFVFYRE